MEQNTKIKSVRDYLVGKSEEDIIRDFSKLSKDKMHEIFLKVINQHNVSLVQRMIDIRVDINRVEKYGACPLGMASGRGFTDIVELLIQKGAKIDTQDTEKWTPLMFACQTGHENIVEILINNGANVNNKSKIGITPIYLAVKHDYFYIAKLLLDNGANIKIGLSSLEAAKRYKRCDMLKKLFEKNKHLFKFLFKFTFYSLTKIILWKKKKT